MLAELAAQQDGVVARRQLLAAGVTDRQITRRLAVGRLVRVHRGVYAVGHPRLRPAGFAWAAVLYAGPGALLAHRSAGASWDVCAPPARHEVLAHSRRVAGSPGVRVDARAIQDVVARLGPRAAGRGVLLALLDEASTHGVRRTRSELEDRFLELVLAAGLRGRRRNATVLGMELDCWWPRARLAVELDGRAHHARVTGFAADRARDRALTLAGIRVLRYAWEDVERHAEAVRGELSALL